MKCRYCSSEIESDLNYCTNCGKKVFINKKKKAVFIIFITYILAFLCFFLAFMHLYSYVYKYEGASVTEEQFVEESQKLGCEITNVLENESYENIISYYVTDINTCSYLMSYTEFDNTTVMGNFYYSLIPEANGGSNQNFSAYYSNNLSYKKVSLVTYNEYSVYSNGIYKNRIANIKDKKVLYFEVNVEDKDKVDEFKKNIGAYFSMDWSILIGFMLGFMIIEILLIISVWKLFVKMGMKGWKSLIPIYNLVCLSKAVLGKKRYAFLLLIPYVNIVFIISLILNLAKVFGKDIGMQILCVMFSTVFIPFIAFDNSVYTAPVIKDSDIDTSEQLEEKKPNIFVVIICWAITLFMLFLLLGSVLLIFEEKDLTNVIMFIFSAIFSIMACPLISKYTRRFKKYTKYKKFIVIGLIILFFFLIAML